MSRPAAPLLMLSLAAALLTTPAWAAEVGAAGFVATMQPIAKGAVPVPGCTVECPAQEPADGNGQRVADRTAPEFPAARRTMMDEPDSSEVVDVPPSDSLLGGETVLSLPGATVPLPLGIR